MSPKAVPAATAPWREPAYWADACAYLGQRDRVMKKIIAQVGDQKLLSKGEPFETLARSIVGQQVSVKAAQAVWDRLVQLPKAMTPAQLLKLKVDDLRATGLSARKIDYLVDLALNFDSGNVQAKDWPSMDDDAIIAQLVGIRGLGRWTAEMFLMFHLLRPNVLPLDDPGLIKGMSQLYFGGDPVSRSDARELARSWEPYCTVATWYVWRGSEKLAA